MAKPTQEVVKASDVQSGGSSLAVLNGGLTEEFAMVLKENVGSGQVTPFDLERIKLPSAGGLSFQMPTSEEKVIEGVIIAFSDARAYWSQSIEEGGSGRPPDCHSMDTFTGVGNPGGDCLKCPFAQFGSAVKAGGKQSAGQACKAMRNLLILRGDSLLPDLLIVPPTSLKPIRQYFISLAKIGVPYFGVVTRLELEKDKSQDNIVYSKIKPSMAMRIPVEQLPMLRSLSSTMKGVLGTITLTQDDYQTVTNQEAA